MIYLAHLGFHPHCCGRAQGGSRKSEPNGSKKSHCSEGIFMEDDFVDVILCVEP
jgi:hypothetical protein